MKIIFELKNKAIIFLNKYYDRLIHAYMDNNDSSFVLKFNEYMAQKNQTYG